MVVEKILVVNAMSFIGGPAGLSDLIQLQLVDEGSPWGANLVLKKQEVTSLELRIGDKIRVTVSKP